MLTCGSDLGWGRHGEHDAHNDMVSPGTPRHSAGCPGVLVRAWFAACQLFCVCTACMLFVPSMGGVDVGQALRLQVAGCIAPLLHSM